MRGEYDLKSTKLYELSFTLATDMQQCLSVANWMHLNFGISIFPRIIENAVILNKNNIRYLQSK